MHGVEFDIISYDADEPKNKSTRFRSVDNSTVFVQISPM